MTMNYDTGEGEKVNQFSEMAEGEKHLLKENNLRSAKSFMLHYIRANKRTRFDLPYLDLDFEKD